MEGETLREAPLTLPGCHMYVLAPNAESEAEAPEQIVVALEDVLTTGVGFTVTANEETAPIP